MGIMGSGSHRYSELAVPAGRIVAESGHHLLTGGGGGAMAEAGRAFCETPQRKGICIGILKGEVISQTMDRQTFLSHTSSPPNPWVELPIYTHLPRSGIQGRDQQSRNHINVLSADALIVLPGGPGTYSEVSLRVDYGRKLILFLGRYRLNGQNIEHFLSLSRYENQVSIAESAKQLRQMLNAALKI